MKCCFLRGLACKVSPFIRLPMGAAGEQARLFVFPCCTNCVTFNFLPQIPRSFVGGGAARTSVSVGILCKSKPWFQGLVPCKEEDSVVVLPAQHLWGVVFHCCFSEPKAPSTFSCFRDLFGCDFGEDFCSWDLYMSKNTWSTFCSDLLYVLCESSLEMKVPAAGLWGRSCG